MAKYINVEPLIKDGWQLQRYNSGDGYVNQERASLKDIPPADVRPVVRGERHLHASTRALRFQMFRMRGLRLSSRGGTLDGRHFNFCPNCGADLRGGGT